MRMTSSYQLFFASWSLVFGRHVVPKTERFCWLFAWSIIFFTLRHSQFNYSSQVPLIYNKFYKIYLRTKANNVLQIGINIILFLLLLSGMTDDSNFPFTPLDISVKSWPEFNLVLNEEIDNLVRILLISMIIFFILSSILCLILIYMISSKKMLPKQTIIRQAPFQCDQDGLTNWYFIDNNLEKIRHATSNPFHGSSALMKDVMNGQRRLILLVDGVFRFWLDLFMLSIRIIFHHFQL